MATRPFSEKFAAALDQTLSASIEEDLRERFRFGFEHRASFPWLPESRGRRGAERTAALIYALRRALASYNASQLGFVTMESRVPLDPDFREALTAAGRIVANDARTVERFAHSLRYAGFCPEHLTVDEVAQQIRWAIQMYWDRAHSGTSPDPW